MKRIVALFVGGASALCLSLVAGAAQAEPTDPPAPADGPGIYTASCAKCHGTDGKGNTKIGDKARKDGKEFPDLTTSKMDVAKIIDAVTNGITKDGAMTTMKPYKDKLTADQIAKVAAFAAAL